MGEVCEQVNEEKKERRRGHDRGQYGRNRLKV